MPFSQDQFNQFIRDHKVIGHFDTPITLKSGKQSTWYVNWRPITSDVVLIDQVADFIIAFCDDNGLDPDCFYGVPEGATKLGIITQYKYSLLGGVPDKGQKILPMGRSKPKEHGNPADKFFVGAPKGKIVVLEDVTTTGGSLIEAIKTLQELDDIETIGAIGLTNRHEGQADGTSVKDAVGNLGVSYYEMSDARELLDQAT